MNLVLIGYRGTGKSAVARHLAETTGRTAYSSDAEAESRAGCTIADLVAGEGWDAFRDLEAQVIRDLADRNDIIIDTGGGAVLRPENTDALRRTGYLVWLRADPGVIRARIESETGRPSLTGSQSFVDEIENVLAAREPLYRAAADVIVETEGLTPDQVADAVWNAFESR